MKEKNFMMNLAYAIGVLDGATGNSARIELGSIIDDWNDYDLYENKKGDYENNTYTLVYKGEFGQETVAAKLIDVYKGYTIEHIAHLIKQAIDIHQAEIRATILN